MPIRWRKSIKVAPGVRVNVSHRGVRSASVGGRRARMTFGRGGASVGGSLGGGLSWSHRLTGGRGCGCCGPAGASTLLILIVGIAALAKRVWG